MTSRGHALVLSLGLGAATATGAWAAMSTSAIRGAESKPEIVSQREIDARARKLDAWQASLAKSLHARPPKLPAVVRYPRLAMATAPANAALPTPNAPVARAQTEAR